MSINLPRVVMKVNGYVTSHVKQGLNNKCKHLTILKIKEN